MTLSWTETQPPVSPSRTLTIIRPPIGLRMALPSSWSTKRPSPSFPENALPAARDFVVEGQEPSFLESQRMVGTERARAIHEDVDLLFDRHVLRKERAVGTTMDAVVSCMAEAVTVGDEHKRSTRPILRTQQQGRGTVRQREDDFDEPAVVVRKPAGSVKPRVDHRSCGGRAPEPTGIKGCPGRRV